MFVHPSRTLLGVTFLALLLGATGCATKAAPSRGAGFIPMEMMAKDEALPFHSVWRSPGVNWDSYRNVYIARVNTEYLLGNSGGMQGGGKGDLQKDARKLANYTRKKFTQAFRKDPNRRLRVVSNSRGSRTLVAEIALTEVVPSNVALNVLGYAPYGGGAAVKAIKKLSHAESVVAFEARILDGETGEIIAMFADREGEREAPGNLKGLTWYSHAHSIIDDWADQFVRVANRNRETNEVIEDTKPFTLKPW